MQPDSHLIANLSAAIASLRSRGEIVVCALPGHENEVDEFSCDRELIDVVAPLGADDNHVPSFDSSHVML